MKVFKYVFPTSLALLMTTAAQPSFALEELQADTQQGAGALQSELAQAQPAPTSEEIATEEASLKATAAAAESWLKLIDEGNYGASWDAGSNIFRFTIKKDEWIKAEQKLRQPLGKVISRKLIEQRPAKNPKGLPEGDYMVLYYKTSFEQRPDASELITMVLSTDGNWKVLTYHVS